MTNLFPSGIAFGDAFYDRIDERKELIAAINNGRHTVLVAPRRFGKTSLMKKVIEDEKYPYIWIDFMTFTSREEAETKFLSHIANLVTTIGGTEKKIRTIIKKYLSFLQPEISINAASVLSIQFQAKVHAESLVQALSGLDLIAKDNKKRVVIICDEFQEIATIDNGSAFQASIRHAAERARNITYIFSGSKHQALRRLFNGKQNPLYELCDQMPLDLIAADYYHSYLAKESNKRWGKPLSASVIAEILKYTECYPKYVNALCAKLWRLKTLPSVAKVAKAWCNYMFTRKTGISEELGAMTINERKLFRVLCFMPTEKPFSKDFLVIADMSQSNIKRALTQLQEKDLVVHFSNQYRIIDPTYKSYFELFG